ncbi:hypothetical protein BH09PAT4_BH09PAT4_03180 [soil metagenome]
MITRLHRFHGLGSLSFVYKKGSTVRGPLLALRFVPNSRQSEYRVAVVVSRKVHKSAVVRNRIRRRLFAVIREELPNDLGPFDLVFTVFSDRVAEVKSDELRQAVVSLLQKAGLS